ncbi:MAG: hypothetical protein AAGK78_17160, partial [Planctomycetota bacterium]
MKFQFFFVVPAAVSLLASSVFAAPQSVEPDVPLEPGLSMRAWLLGEEIRRLPNLIEGQTGNVN